MIIIKKLIFVLTFIIGLFLSLTVIPSYFVKNWHRIPLTSGTYSYSFFEPFEYDNQEYYEINLELTEIDKKEYSVNNGIHDLLKIHSNRKYYLIDLSLVNSSNEVTKFNLINTKKRHTKNNYSNYKFEGGINDYNSFIYLDVGNQSLNITIRKKVNVDYNKIIFKTLIKSDVTN